MAESDRGAAVPVGFRQYVRAMGPGLVVALTWLGAGDLVDSSVAGGGYGYALMWAMAAALLVRFIFVSIIAKYQLCNQHGESVMAGLKRLHPGMPIFVAAVAIFFGHVYGSFLIKGVGEASTHLAGFGPAWAWSIFWVALAAAIVFRDAYRRLEAVFYVFLIMLRVRPETLCRITEFSEHESNGRELDEGERVAVEVLPVLGQSAAAVEPGDGAFDHPTPGLDDEALHPIGSLDDLGLEIGQDAGQGAVKDRPLIGAVGEQFPEKGKQTEQGRQQRETAVAILNVGGGDDAVQQQALRIDQNMPLLALDQLAGIEAVAVDASPPFSALFTL